MAITYVHDCRDCNIEWEEEYGLNDLPPDQCPNCGSEDIYRCVTQSSCVIFKGAGWSPTGYSKKPKQEKLAREGRYQEFESKEDLARVMRGEAEQNELQKMKDLNEVAKKTLGPDHAVTQREADEKVKQAGDEATKDIQ